MPDIRRTAELVQEISAAAGEQRSGSEQVNKALARLDQIIRQNASQAEEMSGMAEELSSRAEQLNSSVSFFRVSRSGDGLLPEPRRAAPSRRPESDRPAPSRHDGAKASGRPRSTSGASDETGVILTLDDDRDREFEEF